MFPALFLVMSLGLVPLLLVPVLVGVVGWLGLYLRDRKLRDLVPTVDE